ncbi:amidohydrolase [Oceanicaulis sp. LC35]|uniref:amidohydrolase n=1 Tax=Oceanicaulis sp. LC35 TaxID=3349635 RepID=UPI003F86E724
MIRSASLTILSLGVCAIALSGCYDPQAVNPSAGDMTADAVFTGGPIYTGVDAQPTAELIAVDDGRIVFVGSAADGEAYIGETTRTVDLGGAALFPGFTDAHAHILGVGERERSLNLEGTASIEDLKARVAEAAADESASIISGRGWIETHWPEGRFPTAADLDEVEAERPVILVRADGHALVANTAALAAAQITADTPDPEGGAILKDETGQPNGMIIDAAMAPFAALAGQPTQEERQTLYRLGAEVMASQGWTSVHDMSVAYADVDIMEGLAEDGALPIRISVYANPEDYDAVASRAPRMDADGRVIARGVKFYMDGALGSRGAALLEPYEDAPDTSGLFLSEEARAEAMMQRALEDGVQLAIHAIGDAGNRNVLDWMSDSFDAVPASERAVAEPRWRVEHAQILHPDDISRFGEMDVIASMQPSHAIGDLHFAASRIGLHRLEGAYAWRSLIESGAIIAGGSDAPVERGEARIEFYAAAVRRDLNGFADEHWHLEQALDRETALKLFTIWPAYATFREDELGTIEVGKLADFSVFDRDLMTVPDSELADARPVMTVVDGEVVWRAQ